MEQEQKCVFELVEKIIGLWRENQRFVWRKSEVFVKNIRFVWRKSEVWGEKIRGLCGENHDFV